MTPAQIEAILAAGDQQNRALKNLPCSCVHNVLYAGMQVEQKVTRMCGRCKAIAAWEVASKPAEVTQS